MQLLSSEYKNTATVYKKIILHTVKLKLTDLAHGDDVIELQLRITRHYCLGSFEILHDTATVW